jgi:hypothetical protein
MPASRHYPHAPARNITLPVWNGETWATFSTSRIKSTSARVVEIWTDGNAVRIAALGEFLQQFFTRALPHGHEHGMPGPGQFLQRRFI